MNLEPTSGPATGSRIPRELNLVDFHLNNPLPAWKTTQENEFNREPTVENWGRGCHRTQKMLQKLEDKTSRGKAPFVSTCIPPGDSKGHALLQNLPCLRSEAEKLRSQIRREFSTSKCGVVNSKPEVLFGEGYYRESIREKSLYLHV